MTRLSVDPVLAAIASDVISARHLGANFLFNRETFREGVGDGVFDETAQSLGLLHLRYPGGTIAEQQFDLANPDSTFQNVDLTTGMPITNTNQHDLTPLSEFLVFADQIGAQVSIVLPSARYISAITGTDPAARAAAENEIKNFVTDLLGGPFGHVIEAFELGNEWYAFGFASATRYGMVADRMAVWVQQAIDQVANDVDPLIALQTAQRSAFPQETSEILAQLSSEALDAVDAAILHNYRPFPWNDSATTAGKFAHVALVEQATGRLLQTLVTEWNVANGSPADGLLQGAGVLEMFNQMLRLGMDLAHIWPVLQNNTTRLAADAPADGSAPDLMIGGEIYRQMLQSLPGSAALGGTSSLDVDGNGSADLLVHSYAPASGIGLIMFLSSLRADAIGIDLALSALAPQIAEVEHAWLTRTGVAQGIDPLSPAALPQVNATSLSHLLGAEGSGTLALDLDPYEILRLEFAGPDMNVVTLPDTDGFDVIRASAAAEVIVLGDDDARELVRDFDVNADRLDLSSHGISSFDQLIIENLTRRDGSVNWVEISDPNGEAIVAVRFAPGTELDGASLDSRHFVLSQDEPAQSGPAIVHDTAGYDDLRARPGEEEFVLLDDGIRDVIRDFDLERDQIDISAWGARDIGEVLIENGTRWDGSTNWVQILDPSGEAELALRFANGAPLDASQLQSEHFIFAEPGQSNPARRVFDRDGVDDLRGETGSDVFIMRPDRALDLIKGFEAGVDQIDLSALGAESLQDLELQNLARKNGTVSWVEVSSTSGEAEFVVRFEDAAQTDVASLTSADFIFA